MCPLFFLFFLFFLLTSFFLGVVNVRRMIRQVGGARFLIGLAEHDSHKIRTLAIASLANALCCSQYREQERWIRNLTSYRAQKIFSSIMISPLADVTSNSSREAARGLINISLPSFSSVSYEYEVAARSTSHWTGSQGNYWKKSGVFESDHDARCDGDGSGSSGSSSEDSNGWKLDLTYQSGGPCVFDVENVMLRFEHRGVLTGSMFDKSEEDGMGQIRGKILWIRGWYDFDLNNVGMGQISFSIYKSEGDANHAMIGLLSGGLKSNDYLGGQGAIRNFTGYCNSQSNGYFGLWENSVSTQKQRKSMKLNGGGAFRLRWRRAVATLAGSMSSFKK